MPTEMVTLVIGRKRSEYCYNWFAGRFSCQILRTGIFQSILRNQWYFKHKDILHREIYSGYTSVLNWHVKSQINQNFFWTSYIGGVLSTEISEIILWKERKLLSMRGKKIHKFTVALYIFPFSSSKCSVWPWDVSVRKERQAI